MTALICGSLAFDNVMTFQGRFRDHILPDQIHILNVSFLVPDMQRAFGGCAGNIAYNLRLLEAPASVVATLGEDGADYLGRLDRLGIDRTRVTVVPGRLTAQAFIITDLENNQITAFHPGAMLEAHVNRIDGAGGKRIAIVAPDGPRGMLQHAEALREADTPFIFDPGQAMPSFDAEQLEYFIERATVIAVNDYEGALLAERTGRPLEEIAREVDALIVTRGGHGSTIYADGERIDVAAVAPEPVVDPTGCGDAYRAGLLYGIMNGLDWQSAARIASTLATFKLEHHGAQSHRPTREDVLERCTQAYGADVPIAS
ncbi:MAG: carbohydrate kinase family protein [Gammaproteobacteria bacterium]|nr:carbohydrate kinase family protein [Gammaproteobacteria bacterium]